MAPNRGEVLLLCCVGGLALSVPIIGVGPVLFVGTLFAFGPALIDYAGRSGRKRKR